MISVTEQALAKIKEISEQEGIGHLTVRVKVIGGGCAGFSYDMFYDDQVSDLDDVSEHGDVKVVCDPLSQQYLDESEIDWQETPVGAGFKFNNPNVTGSCGCGNSFSV